MTPTLPEHVGLYDLRRVIGTGGTATVYLATRRGEGAALVALKLVHAHLRSEAQIAKDLLEEARLTQRIRHPRVVSVLDHGEDEAGTYLVLEYVEGLPLADLLPDGTTAPDPRLGLAALCDALEGLHAAHELLDPDGKPAGLVHRDFTPHNILVGVDGRAKLSDFGIAKAQVRSNTTKQGFVKGKAAYMAPEQIRGKGIDRRCDIWAAGVVAWEVFAGRRLYSADDINAMFRIVAEDPPLLRTVNDQVPERVEAVVARALSRNPDGRFATAVQLRQELIDAWTATATMATAEDVGRAVRAALSARNLEETVKRPAPAPVVASDPTPAPRRWGPVAVGAVVALGLASALVAVLRADKPVTPVAQPAPEPIPMPAPAPARLPTPAPVVETAPPAPAPPVLEKPRVAAGGHHKAKPETTAAVTPAAPAAPPPAAVEPAPAPAAPLAANPYEKSP